MIIDKFKSDPSFPFRFYFRDPHEFSQAQLYWSSVFRAALGDRSGDWHPISVNDNMPLEERLSIGTVLWLENADRTKQIAITIRSFEGIVDEILTLNASMADEDLEEYRKLYGDNAPITDLMRNGVTPEEASADAAKWVTETPLMAWVERRQGFPPEIPNHEQLYLTSIISGETEPLAIQALQLFAQPGSAYDRVNSAFSPDEPSD